MKKLCALLIISLLTFSIYPNGTPDQIYRPLGFDSGTCGNPLNPVEIDVSGTNGSFSEFEKSTTNSNSLCSIQRITDSKHLNYDIAFIELTDKTKENIVGKQIDDLMAYIDATASEPLSVYIYIHGWRNNAQIGNEDVSKFHSILALSKMMLKKATHENRKVLGIYVGWRGASILQTGTNEFIDVAVSLPTFPGRKRQADQHADRIRPFLIALEERLMGDKNKNQLVLIGHSLGGNMLLRATTPLLIERLMESKQGELARGFGSLIILLNPASELTEWAKLQRASRLYSGIRAPDKDSYLTKKECEKSIHSIDSNAKKCKSEGTTWIYPPNQTPVILSLTASAHFDYLSDASTTDYVATKLAFSTSQFLFKWPREESDLIALGQAIPIRHFTSDGKHLDHENPENNLFGLTHEIEVNQGGGISMNYAQILQENKLNNVQCNFNKTSFTTYLREAIESAKKSNPAANGRDWNQEELWLDNDKLVQLNVKHSVARGRCSGSSIEPENFRFCGKISQGRQIPRLGDSFDPFWNTAVHPNLIEGHGLYLSFNLWCFIHGLVN